MAKALYVMIGEGLETHAVASEAFGRELRIPLASLDGALKKRFNFGVGDLCEMDSEELDFQQPRGIMCSSYFLVVDKSGSVPMVGKTPRYIKLS